MMVLADTSVWVRFLSSRPTYSEGLAKLLDKGLVVGHELVYGELLIGDSGGRLPLLADYERMQQAPLVPHREVVEFARVRRLCGKGIGWIDIHLLASALVDRLELWTADIRLAGLAVELGVAFQPDAVIGS